MFKKKKNEKKNYIGNKNDDDNICTSIWSSNTSAYKRGFEEGKLEGREEQKFRVDKPI